MVTDAEKTQIKDAIRIAKEIVAESRFSRWEPSEAVDKCPKCGGTSGYTYQYEVRYDQWCLWDGTPIAADTASAGKEFKMCECVDCGKRMRRPMPTNEEK